MFERARTVASTDKLEIIREALHSSNWYIRAAAAGRLRDLAVSNKVPRAYAPEVLRLLDIYWDNKEYCALMLQSLAAIGGRKALEGFDARLAAASGDLVSSDRWLVRTKALDTIDSVHSLIDPNRGSYEVTCLALLHILVKSHEAKFSTIVTRSRDSTPLQRSRAFAILRLICPDLVSGQSFEQDSHIQVMMITTRLESIFGDIFGDAIAETIGHTFGESIGSKLGGSVGAKIGGSLGGKAPRGARRAIKEAMSLDEPALRVVSGGRPDTDIPEADMAARHLPDMPNPSECSKAELAAWLEDRIKLLTHSLLHPDVATLRARWREAC